MLGENTATLVVRLQVGRRKPLVRSTPRIDKEQSVRATGDLVGPNLFRRAETTDSHVSIEAIERLSNGENLRIEEIGFVISFAMLHSLPNAHTLLVFSGNRALDYNMGGTDLVIEVEAMDV